ncbi:MAG: hypothetical protein U0625_12930 [Phycisphaerales bacterium]
MQRTDPSGLHRGITILEVAVSCVVCAALLAALVPMLGSGTQTSGVLISANNLRRISAGCVAYEADWNGRQWSQLTDEMATWPSCATYRQHACPPNLTLGEDSNESLWGYWIYGSPQACSSYPGSCGNWVVNMPIVLGGTTGSLDAANAGVGSWMFVNARPVRPYICGRFYDPVFYPPNDEGTYSQLQVSAFGSMVEFDYNSLAGGCMIFSGYGLSPAALWNPGVFRKPSLGGYQQPDSFVEGYQTPTAAQAVYPSLKTRLMERNWCQQPPVYGNPCTGAGNSTPNYAFNAGGDSQPGAIFFDGHVEFTAMSRYAADDEEVRMQGMDGLWSRDTPYGATGVRVGPVVNDFACSAHLLTTDGIAGRDLTHNR